MNLFRIDFRAARARIRPSTWVPESGLCTLFLFADDCDDAAARAVTILSALPYVRLDDEAVVHNYDDLTAIHVLTEEDEESGPAAVFDELEDAARWIGFSFAFAAIGHAQPRVSGTAMIRYILHPEAPQAPPSV